MSALLQRAKRASRQAEQARARREGASPEALAQAPPIWEPWPGEMHPQRRAYFSEADELFYGGAAGGGKTDLLLGLAFTAHRSSIIFRREYPQLRGIIKRGKEILGGRARFNANENVWRLPDGREVELGAVQHEDDKEKYQGRAHDLKAFDELPHFTQSQYEFLTAWNRTAISGQRCRVVAAGNPPVPGQEGAWILAFWAPWLDPKFPDPAVPGEIRWYAKIDDELVWLESGEPFEHTDAAGRTETIYPRSRTFIPARVTDNPRLLETGYIRTLQALPEPLRSQLLYGDFNATAEDDPWQCIPTAWVRAAMERGERTERPVLRLSCLGVDPARGGKDKTVLSRRVGPWFAPLEKYPGSATPDGPAVATLVVQAVSGEDAPVNMDAIGIGSSPFDILKANGIDARPINFSNGSQATDRSGKFKFRNLRAEAYWRLREALDPASGDELALPNDPELLADLCAPRYKVTAAGIQIESKEDLKERLGRSPDCGDAVVLAHYIEERRGYPALFGSFSRG